MEDRDKRFVLAKFAEYYGKRAVFRIPSIDQREFGIGNIKKIDARHMAFGSEPEFRNYLSSNTPLFVSHSAAYYERPAATPMENKGLKGADLIFDLDLHAEGKYGVYALIGKVKGDAIALMENFLAEDFGISKSEMLLVFSGNRGYHIHVRDKAYQDLGTEERRELVDYISGAGLNYLNFFTEEEIPGRKLTRIIGPKPDDPGYRGRFARAVIEKLNRDPHSVSPVFSKPEKREKFIDGMKEGDWNRTSLTNVIRRFKDTAAELPVHSISADSGVTQDVRRLIRVPNSIHGETGLVAKIVDDANTFSPLHDALAFPMNRALNVEFLEDVPALELGQQSFSSFAKNEKKELPEAFAILLLLKGSVRLV
jgi:DNA primase small subunit